MNQEVRVYLLVGGIGLDMIEQYLGMKFIIKQDFSMT